MNPPQPDEPEPQLGMSPRALVAVLVVAAIGLMLYATCAACVMGGRAVV